MTCPVGTGERSCWTHICVLRWGTYRSGEGSPRSSSHLQLHPTHEMPTTNTNIRDFGAQHHGTRLTSPQNTGVTASITHSPS